MNKEKFLIDFIKLKEKLSREHQHKPLESGASADDVDLATSERDNSLELKLNHRNRFLLNKINRAIEKIKLGTFGECEECGEKISRSRLLARPMAELCITCKEEQESQENKISYSKRSHTKGKEIVNATIYTLSRDAQDAQENVIKLHPQGHLQYGDDIIA